MLKRLLLAVSCLMAGCAASASGSEIWSIGKADRSAGEFALAPSGFRNFIAEDFGYEDKFYLVNRSSAADDFPYVLPGPADTWGGTWPTAGWRTHQVNILFGLEGYAGHGHCRLVIDLADFSKRFIPLVKVSVNTQDSEFRPAAPGYDASDQKKPGQMEPVTDTLSLAGDYSEATPYRIEIPIKPGVLRNGGNEITISVLEGSWILFDHVALEGGAGVSAQTPGDVFIRDIAPAGYEIQDGGKRFQPLVVDVEHIDGEPVLDVELDGKRVFSSEVEKGRYQFEVPMPAVKKAKSGSYRVLCDGKEIASGTVARSPQRTQTLADYVDTRIGTAHSRWMIAPGPWMPFSMVKMSPDNQNTGWQAGYQPSFENIGCFSHIHEWTMGGLGIMAANGKLETRVGDEQDPDGGYRSRIDKRTEKAGIGYYAADLTDYGIKAEVTATTRCGFERFTFPADRGDGRILIELHPQTEYGIQLKSVDVRKVNDFRIEGSVHQFSLGVWSNDADQDYVLNFVIEFDRPIKSLGSWLDGDITPDTENLLCGECGEAGLFAVFDTGETPVVQVRSGISLVSVDNASENLLKEVSEPFGWDFEAVKQNQIDTWNELFDRITVKTDNRLEKVRFYNNMEYSYDDWTVGQLAKSLGDEALYKKFNDRGYWWKNVISEDGYCQMKDSKGQWLPDFDPFRSGANQHYVEGNAWQLTFFVPQDVPALVEKIGKERFTGRLLWGFNQDEAFRYNAPNDQYWDHPVVQGNQQSMHFAFLFNWAGTPWNTQKWSRSILERYYGYGTANAYLGDEDQGQMSAWAVMVAIGLFQTDGGCRAEPVYEIASPSFEEVTIDLGGRYGRGGKFTIKAHNASRNNIYVQSAVLNGKPLNSFMFPASELLKGGELVLEMGPEPDKDWGVE